MSTRKFYHVVLDAEWKVIYEKKIMISWSTYSLGAYLFIYGFHNYFGGIGIFWLQYNILPNLILCIAAVLLMTVPNTRNILGFVSSIIGVGNFFIEGGAKAPGKLKKQRRPKRRHISGEAGPAPDAGANAEAICRVFISSVFMDMDHTRDILMGHVLPRIKVFARKYRKQIEFIDYRWGIDARSGSIRSIEICLEQVANADFIIALIGKRAGWRPGMESGFDRKTLSSLKNWKDSYNDKSITNLEIIQGVFDKPDKPSLFFIQKNTHEFEKSQYELARDVKASKNPYWLIREYERLEDETYKGSDVHEAAAEFESAVKAMLIKAWGAPPKGEEDGYVSERNKQDAFRGGHCRWFFGHAGYLKRLTGFAVGGDDPLLLIKGKPGSGKSALMSMLYSALAEGAADSGILRVFVSCGLSSDSSDVSDILRYICTELSARASVKNIAHGIRDTGRLAEAFHSMMHEISSSRRIVLIIDAVDRLAGDESDTLFWLRGGSWANIRIIMTCADGRKDAAALQIGGRVEDMPSLAEPEIKGLINDGWLKGIKPDGLFD